MNPRRFMAEFLLPDCTASQRGTTLSGMDLSGPPRISAFPKCYLDEIAAARTMSVFEWVDMAKGLDADGLEMYEGFFTSLDSDYLAKLHDAIHAAGFEMPMLCCSPDFTNPSADARKQAVDHEV